MKDFVSGWDRNYAKRAFVHWIVGKGYEEGELSEGREMIHMVLKKSDENKF